MNVGLSGYGMSLSIKKSNYNVTSGGMLDLSEYGDNLDTSDPYILKSKQTTQKQHIYNGFNITRLIERFPDKKEDLSNLKQELISESQNTETLKASQLSKIPSKFLNALKDINSFSQLNFIFSNFPVYIKKLSKMKFNSKTKANSQLFEKFVEDNNIKEGIYYEGNPLDNLMSDKLHTKFIRHAQSAFLKSSYFNLFEGYNLDSKMWDKLAELSSIDPFQNKRLKINQNVVTWLNNLEKDRIYRNWPSKIVHLFQMNFFGGINPVALNAYNFVSIVNPNDPFLPKLLETLLYFIDQKIPLRIGLILNTNKTSKIEHLLASGFYFLETKSPKTAMNFLTKALNTHQLTIKTIKSVFQSFSKLSIENIDSGSDEVQDRIDDVKSELKDLGIGTESKYFLNGKQIVDFNVQKIQSLFKHVNEELIRFYQKYSESPTDDINELITLDENWVNRMNFDLMNSPPVLSNFSLFLQTDKLKFISNYIADNSILYSSHPNPSTLFHNSFQLF